MANVFGNPDSTPKERETERNTDCVIHNTTGYTIRLVSSKEWDGHPTAPYPPEIQNDQVVSFSHGKGRTSSAAGVVYRGKHGTKGDECDHMMAWSNPRTADQNSVWTETREVDHYTDTEWKPISEQLAVPRTNHTDIWEDCMSTITITNETSAKVEAKFTRKPVDDDA